MILKPFLSSRVTKDNIRSYADPLLHQQRGRRRRGPWKISTWTTECGDVILAKGGGVGANSLAGPFQFDFSPEEEEGNSRGESIRSNNKGVHTIEIYPHIAWSGVSNRFRRVAGGLPQLWSRIKADPNSFLDRVATGAKIAVFAVIGVELFLVVRNIFKEAISEYRDTMAAEEDTTSLRGLLQGNSANGPVLSTSNVKLLLLWLEDPNKEARSAPPKDVSPAWMIPVAEELRECKAFSLADVQRILLKLTKGEALMLQSCLLPKRNMADIQDIGGLVGIKGTILKWLVSSLSGSRMTPSPNSTETHTNSSPFQDFVSDNTGPRSLCLWGPPGCGKSLLIRATANLSGLPTLVITPSMIQRKWYGESTERVRTFFKLVNTLGSCMVVMDEMDGLFMSRRDDDHEVTREIKTEWLQWWDGLAAETLGSTERTGSTRNRRVLFVAATNRPWDVDAAAWRRLGHRIYVGLPNFDDRMDLMRKWLKDLPQQPSSVLTFVAQATEGYPASDVHNVFVWACQNGPVARNDAHLEIEDFQKALVEVPATQFSAQYASQLRAFFSTHRQGTSSNTYFSQSPDSFSLNHQNNNMGHPSFGQSLSNYLPNEDGLLWQTPMGNFYQVQVPVDSSVIEAIQDILWSSLSDSEDHYWNDWEDFFSDFDDDSDSEDDCL